MLRSRRHSATYISGFIKDGYNQDSTEKTKENLSSFWFLFALAQITGLAAIALVFYRNIAFFGGFKMEYPTYFNWHPLLMSIGPIYCMGNALVAFKVLRGVVSKIKAKIIHAILNGVALLTAVLAITAVYSYHIKSNIPNFYSLHSWVGLMALSSFFIQSSFGLVAFLFPGLNTTIRQTLLPYHVFFGQAIFTLSVVSAIAGLNERAIFSMGPDYRDLPPPALILNAIGLLCIIYSSLILFLSTNSSYKRVLADTMKENKDNS